MAVTERRRGENEASASEQTAPALDSAPSAPSSWLARVLWRAVLGLLVAQGLYNWFIHILEAFTGNQSSFDFSVYYTAALALRDNPHADIFSEALLLQTAAAHGAYVMNAPLYLYPPLLAVLLTPLTFVSVRTAAQLWATLNIVLWAASALLLVPLTLSLLRPSATAVAGGDERGGLRAAWALARGGWRRLVARLDALPDEALLIGAVTVYLLFTHEGLIEVLAIGQVSIVVFFLLLLAPWLERRNRPMLAGVVLVVAALIKVFPVVILGYYLLRGRWRVILGALIGGVVACALMALYIGVGGVLATYKILTNGSSSGEQFQNESLAHAPFWIESLILGHQAGGRLSALVGDALIGLVALAFVAGVLYVSRRRQTSASVASVESRQLLGYGWALCTMILVSPVTWQHHLAWTLPAFLFCLAYVVRVYFVEGRGDHRRVRIGALLSVALIVGYVVLARELPFGYDGRQVYDPSPYLLHRIPLRPFFMLLRPLGVLLIWGVAGYLFLRAGAHAPVASVAPAPQQPASANAAPAGE